MKMNHKIQLKKTLFCSAGVILAFLLFLPLSCFYQYQCYTRHFNQKIEAVFSKILREYPDTRAWELMEILNGEGTADGGGHMEGGRETTGISESVEYSEKTANGGESAENNSGENMESGKKTTGSSGNMEYDKEMLENGGEMTEDTNFLRQYGIDIEKNSAVLVNDTYFRRFTLFNLGAILLLSLTLLFLFLNYNRKKDRQLAEITSYLHELNRKNYKLDIDDNTEDELSILKNEIYKTTIMLKEQAENSLKDKIALKDSLSDISHQLKTPFTSILIMLDNLTDNPDMEPELRNEFIKDIRKKITNVNFLVQALLKLSRFDANTISFTDRPVSVSELISRAVENVSVLCDLKNIEIKVSGPEENTISCDARWQVEALTNLLKNSVEYSAPFSSIQVTHEKNQLYSWIEIRDTGKGIDPEDIGHIFERFYRGKRSSQSMDNVGIGLPLSKAIIEKDRGTLSVDSEAGKGTVFVVKYFM